MKLRPSYLAGIVLISTAFIAVAVQPYAIAGPREDAVATVHKMHDPTNSCSAVMIAPERALTARHCMTMDAPVVTINGVDYPVSHAYGNPALDLALLVIPDAPCPCAKPAPVAVKSGEKVMVIGYPYGIGRVVTYGEMQERVVIGDVVYVMITAPARPGNSGGGVFNEKGELLGIVSLGDMTGYLTFFVEIEPLLGEIWIQTK